MADDSPRGGALTLSACQEGIFFRKEPIILAFNTFRVLFLVHDLKIILFTLLGNFAGQQYFIFRKSLS